MGLTLFHRTFLRRIGEKKDSVLVTKRTLDKNVQNVVGHCRKKGTEVNRITQLFVFIVFDANICDLWPTVVWPSKMRQYAALTCLFGGLIFELLND